MAFFEHLRGIATEAQGDGDASEISLVRDARGNWINEKTGNIYARVREPEDGEPIADD